MTHSNISIGHMSDYYKQERNMGPLKLIHYIVTFVLMYMTIVEKNTVMVE